jgi:tryptophan halogenase
MSTQKKPSIIIVGGGTAGWITLSYIAATLDVDLTIVHSEEIDTMGVGESTTPTIKHVAETVGVSERDWMRDANASFKYGLEFNNFHKKNSRWFHTFDDIIPHQAFSRPIIDFGKTTFKKELTSLEYYLTHYKSGVERYNRTHGAHEFLAENKLSPYNRRGKVNISQYPGYSYHINAFNFGNSLRLHTDKNKFTEIKAKVKQVVYNEQGIDYLLLEDDTKLKADIYFDCTGFHRLLIGKLSSWEKYHELVNNAAVWGPIKGFNTYNPFTRAHAQDAGWIWEVPTWNQIGSGYVYCTDFCSDEQAVETITKFWANRGQVWNPIKQVKFITGRQENPSIKNVISNGLAQSFLEPLEATSVMLTCSTVTTFVDIFKRNLDRPWGQHDTEVHNRTIKQFTDHTKRFVYYHYALSERDDSEYWKHVGNKPGAVEEVSDYLTHLMKGRWAHKGESLLNQFNWGSMLLGFEKNYTGELPYISPDQINEYVEYTELLIANYKSLTKNNYTVQEFLESLHKD